MNKLLIAALAVLSVGTSFAEPTASEAKAPEAKQKPKVVKNFKEIINRREGGFIVDVRQQKGRLVIVNAQSAMDDDNIRAATKAFEKDMKIKIEFEKGTFDLKTAKGVAEATVFVINDETLPSMMVAADDHWGFVNVAKLKTDKEAFYKSRVRKEIVRVAGFILGAGDSFMYPMCLTGHVNGAAKLDDIPSEQLPVDVLQRVMHSMEQIGVKPYRNTTYRKACEEGWAPQPTNDFQKAVWDKVHELPTKPIQIKPETKKVVE